MSLFQHGILREKSTYRVHVCPQVNAIYTFPTQVAIKLISNKKYEEVKGYNSNNQFSAVGYVIPVNDMPQLKEYSIPTFYRQFYKFERNDSESEKGKKAEEMVYKLIYNGKLFECKSVKIVEDEIIQREFGDIELDECVYVEVKCDFIGGIKTAFCPNVTSNLFIQIAEKNYMRGNRQCLTLTDTIK